MDQSVTPDTQPPQTGLLKRGLKNRHIQLIALGGCIGTGLFLGSAGVIQLAGPAMILGYLIGGIIEFFIMRQLGEMVVEEPVAGSFAHFAYKYWSKFAGFMSGWNYWVLYVLVGMAELTAVAKYIHWWMPDMPQWIPVLVFFILINAINLANVKIFGEAEFWFAIIKVLAVIGLIVFGAYLLIGGGAGPEAGVSNLWKHGGFFAPAESGFAMFQNFSIALVLIMFSFGGLELVGVSAAETANPKKTIPRAVNQVFFRILIFYVGALTVMIMLQPWPEMVKAINAVSNSDLGDRYGASPFVLILKQMHVPSAAGILNFIILTAALSVYNSGVYCNSRMLYSMADKGNAPALFKKTDRRGVPVNALIASACGTGIGVLINYTMPGKALGLLFALVVAALVLNWALISFTHLMFRRAKNREGYTTSFKSWGFPVTNWICIGFVAFILFVMAAWAGMRTSVIIMPIWIGVLALLYWILHRKPKQGAQ
ncbi:aromatic amino acid transport protein AroP [Ereboglobus sp. PH5-5]|uniref:amino acid permease n=1 Tax=Ereboglobus sp. PH5-5 TaxID=2940529 RepID=UPI002405F51F|nr:amino acid permease [Ereboglobus sp. PH5-5]MDF9831833.1 aromatic amino acid transport protein AroP [Ereboglobus sp. PH5-5]